MLIRVLRITYAQFGFLARYHCRKNPKIKIHKTNVDWVWHLHMVVKCGIAVVCRGLPPPQFFPFENVVKTGGGIRVDADVESG